ncbi:hypothetical protein [Neotabrizicola shimadae]|uniref:Uncharacterized protein n=1 Tax=Neotabrizicola shimadae TaxID=2807096 RepID=A0A8G0ZY31_9RHOB|nr:hypothetical protein [Neotabrizicola shimadae]QYZ71137.1 hypothetical protein JO391_06425 [Neotabrizicola shimadae]
MSELEARLAALAAAGETITYGALARDLGWRLADLTAALERLMAEDTAAGRPLRAALMRGRLSGDMPARGFFDAAAGLGYDVSDPAAFVLRQRAALRTP